MAKSKNLLLGIAAVLLVGQAFINVDYLHPRWSKEYSMGKQGGLASGLGADQAFLELLGFREFLAGMLWVRGDTFFENGNYDAVLPIIRLVTMLDPKNVDVFGTGMWHIGYNFTDEDQRSDRRYLPTALALGKEGAQQNKETYELYYEEAWLWYHKIDDDYPQAVRWLKDATSKPDIPPARRNLLRNAYERNGQPDEALKYMYELQAKAKADYDLDPSRQTQADYGTLTSNIDTTVVRLVQRGNMAKANGGYDQGDYDTKPPFNVGFSAKVTVLEPKVLLVEGTWNVLPVGTRVRVVLRDKDMKDAIPGGADWDKMATSVQLDPPRDLTFMQDQLFVRNMHFSRRIDMSKDPTMYPFAKDNYIIEFYYNPRSAPPHMQDKFGWNGEGMTDTNFLRTDVRPGGQRIMYTSLDISRDQILQRGKWSNLTTVLKTKNYKETGGASGADDDVIMVPSLRSTTSPSAATTVPPGGATNSKG
ncbi:MAG: hypothetical protein QOJ65_1377 [Fimbriimonadaceae bacterium]|jgi:hypothetical protein|nr:hypothetical protein [Fimbriimonadaceae bacterium]